MQKTEETGFFQHEGGVCTCTVCGASAPSARQIKHALTCPVGRLQIGTLPVSSVEERVSNLEYAMADLDNRVDKLNKLLERLGTLLKEMDVQR